MAGISAAPEFYALRHTLMFTSVNGLFFWKSRTVDHVANVAGCGREILLSKV
jgi:hypothetical protein